MMNFKYHLTYLGSFLRCLRRAWSLPACWAGLALKEQCFSPEGLSQLNHSKQSKHSKSNRSFWPPFSTSAPHRLLCNILHPSPMDHDAESSYWRGRTLREDAPACVSHRYVLSPEIRFSLSMWAHHFHKTKQHAVTNCSNLLPLTHDVIEAQVSS